VVRHRRIVQTCTYEGFPEGVALDGFVASGMETGVVEGYEKLDEVLASMAAGPGA
jgi:hypothetical protein